LGDAGKDELTEEQSQWIGEWIQAMLLPKVSDMSPAAMARAMGCSYRLASRTRNNARTGRAPALRHAIPLCTLAGIAPPDTLVRLDAMASNMVTQKERARAAVA
jgi:hypothetical protein